MIEDHVTGHGTLLSVLAVQTIQRPPSEKEEKEREKEKAKDDPKGPEEHSLVMSKRKVPNGGKKTTQFGGPRERKARRACQKAMLAAIEVVFVLTSPTKEQARIMSRTKARDRTKKEKSKEETFPQSGFSAPETPNAEGYGQAWESDDSSANQWTDDSWSPGAGWICTKSHTAWMVATPLNLVNHPNTRDSGSWLHTVDWSKSGNRKIQEACMVLWHYDRILPL